MRLREEIVVKHDFITMLSQAKSICVIHKIPFPTDDYIELRDYTDTLIECEKFNLSELLTSAYEATFVADKIDIRTEGFIKTFNKYLDKLIIVDYE